MRSACSVAVAVAVAVVLAVAVAVAVAVGVADLRSLLSSSSRNWILRHAALF